VREGGGNGGMVWVGWSVRRAEVGGWFLITEKEFEMMRCFST
jgi:hypothetical protein